MRSVFPASKIREIQDLLRSPKQSTEHIDLKHSQELEIRNFMKKRNAPGVTESAAERKKKLICD